MAETVKHLTITVHVEGFVEGTDGARLAVDEKTTYRFTEGTGASQVGCVWFDEDRALDTTSEDLQLNALSDFQGATQSALNNVKVLYCKNLDTDAGDTIILGGSGNGNEWDSGPFTSAGDQLTVAPGGLVLIVDPSGSYTITAGDDLNVTAADTSTYDILIAGDNA